MIRSSVKKGELLALTSGEYSSYGLATIAKALKSFKFENLNNIPKCKAELKTSHWDKRQHWDLNLNISELVKAGLIEEVPYVELNVGY